MPFTPAAFDPLRTTSSADPYSRQLQAGLWRLRFAPTLESEFRVQQQAEHKWPACFCLVAILLLMLVFGFYDVSRLDLLANFPNYPLDIWMHLGLRWGCIALIVAVLLRPALLDRRLGPHAALAATALGLCVMQSFAVYAPRGLPAADFSQMLVMAMFLPIGMTFRLALATAVFFIAGYTALTLVVIEPARWHEHHGRLAMLLIALPLGSIGGYLREKASRRHFLTSRVAAYLAGHDPLTGLANRRVFEQRLRALIDDPDQPPMVSALIDADHFKQFNDRFGHAAGDEALRLIGHQLSATADGPQELAARVGGEEFALILAGRIDSAAHRLTDLRITIRNTVVTASIGATALRGDDTLESIYLRADQLLYRSKDDGRDRLSTDAPPQLLIQQPSIA